MSKRFFYNGNISHGSVIISGEEYNHIANTMRAKAGDAVVLFNGDGMDYSGTISAVDKKNIRIEITGINANPCETDIKLTLFQAAPKGDKFELITQKMTELGAVKIVPFISEYCNVRKESIKTDRLKKIALEACKQCGRSVIPEIENVIDFEQAVTLFSNYDIVIMPYEGAEEGSFKKILSETAGIKKIAVVIGSEGGFSGNEVAAAISYGARIVTLGRRIMRSETAAVATVSAVMYELLEWER